MNKAVITNMDKKNISIPKNLYSKSGLKSINLLLICLVLIFSFSSNKVFTQASDPVFQYLISIPQPENNSYNVQLKISNINLENIQLKMPKWMPGYYQIMNYANTIENFSIKDITEKSIPFEKINDNTWSINNIKNQLITINYTIKTSKQFVADSFVDMEHAYLIPENTFLYVDGFLNSPVSVEIINPTQWNDIATGLIEINKNSNLFYAPNFDILYDCPILIGNLEELPAFKVRDINHRFIGYKIGDFDKELFMENLEKIVESAVDIIGDIPYKNYSFIAIGPGRGGIEHLNNTTISFDGNNLKTAASIHKIMNFLAHEYFHHYNVKRIRPFELGPFDYDKGSKTNLLWVSEGLSVYYEYLIVKRAGLINLETLFSHFNTNLNKVENNPGRFHQSLVQASYNTWKDGPFGTLGDEPGKTISYYDKGPIVGLLLDFGIRNATKNTKSLDDVMKMLYWEYYKTKQRGFTDAEFQQVCENIAGTPLTELFEYVYTTKELNYEKYLGYAGLKIDKQVIELKDKTNSQKLVISQIENPNTLQKEILKSWLN